ncbi:antirestriction protein ArdC [Caulobacter radicis]|uniref:ArdC family protein n=1 Tax=Caulobacter radicis TaxID=2172650 RepID=UPI000D577F32|nr:zincin-like metallopeptidase domain-containing protein [Caulobacter radicis]PVM84456.1 antirestriction protein ArdC [Caulobacter radicis]
MRPTGQRSKSRRQTLAAKAAPSSAIASSTRRTEASLYDEVTAKIIDQLEAGRLPWVQPWGRDGGAALSLPRNGVTGRRYSGVNILLLWGAVIEHGYPSQGWLTFRQALAAGGCVRRGERGTTVVYADRFTPKAEQERAAREGDEPGKVAFLKRFTVFNLAQCEGLERVDPEPAPLPERQAVPHAEALIAATGADFRVGGPRAFYDPLFDYVQVPPQPAFADQINYYRTAFHELSHWTGHGSRLDRDQSGHRGGKAYAREELVAEMGAAFVCASLGIVPTVRHADYIGSWLEVLREDNRAIFRAASQASKAADLLLTFQTSPPPEPGADVLAARHAAAEQPTSMAA